METVTAFIFDHLTIEGCDIVEDDETGIVLVITPDIHEDCSIIQLEDNAEVQRLEELLAGRKLIQRTNRVDPGVTVCFLSINRLVV